MCFVHGNEMLGSTLAIYITEQDGAVEGGHIKFHVDPGTCTVIIIYDYYANNKH